MLTIDTLLQTIKKLEKEPRTEREQELYDSLNAEAFKIIQSSMLNITSYGDTLGWEKIDKLIGDLERIAQSLKSQK